MNTIKLKGTYNFEIRDITGKVRDSFEVKNLVVNAGLAQIALLIGDASATPFTYIAVGTSAAAVGASQTALTAEITTNGLERASATIDRTTTTVTNDTFRAVKVFTATGTHVVEEVGVFNAASSGTMLSRALTSTKTVTSGETITVTYTLAFA